MGLACNAVSRVVKAPAPAAAPAAVEALTDMPEWTLRADPPVYAGRGADIKPIPPLPEVGCVTRVTNPTFPSDVPATLVRTARPHHGSIARGPGQPAPRAHSGEVPRG